MLTKQALTQILDDLLEPDLISDYCPNGLQIEGQAEISHIVTGVTANLALIEAAIDLKAQALLVHHGFFWKGEDPKLIGIKYKRIQHLIEAKINLFAYHLPLDIHPSLGNNVQLAKRCGWKLEKQITVDGIPNLLNLGSVIQAVSAKNLKTQLQLSLNREPLMICENPEKMIKTIAWCSGGAGRYLEQAIEQGVDAYLTGEISENHIHLAREADICLLVAGHHATEQDGVKAVGEYLSQTYSIQHSFVNIDSPW